MFAGYAGMIKKQLPTEYQDLVHIFLIIVIIMFIAVASMTYTAYGLTSYNLQLSDSCKFLKCFDICQLDIFDNSTIEYSGPLNYNDGCSRLEPGTIPTPILFSMYGFQSIIEINALEQEHKDQTKITIYPNIDILSGIYRNNDTLIHLYKQYTIDRNCNLIKVTNDFTIIASVLNYALAGCHNESDYPGLGNYNQTIETIEKTVRYPTSSKAFLNYCLSGQDNRYDIIDCYSEFLKYQDKEK